MGLGCSRGEWDDYEWFAFDDVAAASLESLPADTAARVESLWDLDGATRVLLCDLDNLRADSARLRSRLAIAVALARTAHVAAFAGQSDAVERSRAALAEFGDSALAVGTGRNAADHELLRVADAVDAPAPHFIVMSNDGIFAGVAARGALTVVSPGAAALSQRLVTAAVRVVDLDELVCRPADELAVA